MLALHALALDPSGLFIFWVSGSHCDAQGLLLVVLQTPYVKLRIKLRPVHAKQLNLDP